MTTAAAVDPQLKNLAADLANAFSGGPGPSKNFNVQGGNDAAKMATAFISAYQNAVLVNPTKAFKSKGAPAPLQLSDSTVIATKDFWDDAWDIVVDVAPVVINALSKDFKPQQLNLKQIVDKLPDTRKNDKAWTDYATNTLLYGCYATNQCFGGTKPTSLGGMFDSPPTPPAGVNKDWFDDVCDFVSDAAPVVLPIVMSFI